MTQATIDQSALRRLKDVIGGDTDDLAELINDFVSTLPIQVEHMNSQAAISDWVALRITSHSCKSNARDLGALELGDLCAQLETQCKDGEPIDLSDQLAAIADEASVVLRELTSLDPKDV